MVQPAEAPLAHAGAGVIFSDGIESDFLRFGAGMEATVTLAPQTGQLVV